jgi:hypothetical protein
VAHGRERLSFSPAPELPDTTAVYRFNPIGARDFRIGSAMSRRFFALFLCIDFGQRAKNDNPCQ